MTSSPSPIPNARIHKCNPLVPELTAIACEAPTYRAIAFSNSSSLGPKLSRKDLSTSVTARTSSSLISGAERGILIGTLKLYHLPSPPGVNGVSSKVSVQAVQWSILLLSSARRTHPHRDSSYPSLIYGNLHFWQSWLRRGSRRLQAQHR